ncbi:MAG: S8 family peptidase [Lewinellaceae bacterium]|nr:S8 family peptidase [Lewinellaceae bacterium]
MKKILLSVLFLLITLVSAFSQSGQNWRSKVAPDLLVLLDKGEKVDFIAVFREKADLRGVQNLKTKSEKSRFVFQRLEETANRAQLNATRILREQGLSANRLFLVNALAVSQADALATRQLAELQEVMWLGADPWVKFEGPVNTSAGAPAERGTIEWGVEKINAPAAWALGFTGQGVTIGGADTGYEWAHPAIKSHYRGWTGDSLTTSHEYNWHDAIHEINPLSGDSIINPGNNPCGLDAAAPCDDNNHGTHTMGTMAGDDGQGNQIGVAPGANWVGCRNMERGWGKPSSYLECFGWFLAPTDLNGENPNPDKSPHVINNSWYCASIEGCTDLTINELLRTAVINLKAAGVVVVVSNGNDGSNGTCATTSGPPGYFEESFSVGATLSNDTITGFSSRGPVIIDGSNRIKPNVCAPGAAVRSSVRGGGYAHFWGTSMAGPHVAGLVALMISANPDLAGNVDAIEDIIEQTAVFYADTMDCLPSLGTSRPNHAYGWGRIEAIGAVNAALAYSPVNAPEPASPEAGVFPNPTAGEVIFDLNNVSGKTTLEIFAADGKRVFSKTWTAQNHQLAPVSLKNEPQGVYFWQVRAENGVVSGRLVKE